jgi:hypothetical protein
VFEFLFETGDPDHEKLIHVGGKNGEKFQSLQQWIAIVEGFFEHPRVEFEQAQFAIKEELRLRRNRADLGGPGEFMNSCFSFYDS